jgi:pimeloyl-ACP methyl ester carboxylesterase
MMLAQWPIVLSLLAFSDVTVSPARTDHGNTSFHRSLSTLDRPSERTLETLRRYDLEPRYRRDAPGVLMQLEKTARATPESDLVYALAELSWIEGKRLDYKRKGDALDRYVDAVAYAYDYLFAPELAAWRHPSDPRFRLACDLYNGGLDRLIRAAQSSNGRIEPDGVIKLKVHGREQVFRVFLDQQKSPWRAPDIDQIILCSDWEVSGLPTKTYQYGLGVPLIAIRKSDRSGPGPERFYPSEMAFPLTAFLVPNSKLREASVNDTRECTLELVDPVRVHTIGVAPAMALESDLSTPLAYMWAKTDLTKYRWSGLLRPEQNLERAGLMLIRPYEPHKIPVVMVHGLASTPLAWIPMLNDLLRDPRIQDKYQFMLYLYPTGVPLPIAAAGLRETLVEAEKTFNPNGSDTDFSRMVLLGHSMGGLLSHSMVVDSSDRFWQLNSDKRFEDIIGPPEVLAELKRYMFFQPLPFVKRVVFLATPHRGSDLSRGVVGRVGAGLITDPDHIAKLLSRLVKDNPDAFDRRKFRRLPSSIETLETNGKILLALLSMRPDPASVPPVVFHSIVGSLRPGPRETSTDGVVPFSSSHLEGVASELVVRSDHGVQKDPAAVLEVRRILLEHIGIVPQGVATAPARALNE